MSHQGENVNEDVEITKKEPNRNSGPRITISEIKKLLEGLNNSFEFAEDKIDELDYKLIEIIKSGNKNKKKNKASESCETLTITSVNNRRSPREERVTRRKKYLKK